MNRPGRTALILAVVAMWHAPRLLGQDDPPRGASAARQFTPQELARILQHSPLGPPPSDGNRFADNPRAARLGQFLFFDARMSRNGRISCATCHEPANGFADGRQFAQGMGGGTRNTLSLWNVAYNRWLFWDGRADSLWSGALQPMERATELGGDRVAIVRLIRDDPDLRAAYEQIFGTMSAWRDPPAPKQPESTPALLSEADQAIVNLVFSNVGKSVAAYERRLLSRHSPFDVFVEGLRSNDEVKLAALSPSAQRGLKLFVGRGDCRLCHSGPNFSDGEFHDIGVPPRGGVPPDPGRMGGIRRLLADPFNAAGVLSDEPGGPRAERLRFIADGPQNYGEFKTPTLRNVALSAPYMHQGQFATLAEVVEYYSSLRGSTLDGHHGESVLRARDFTADEARDLVEFLRSLTDTEIDKALMAPVDSPMKESDER
jgi:cytochrome c peroxidase